MANVNNANWAPTPNESNESGMQVKAMGLKVNYTFDKDSAVNCLARWAPILHIQTIPIDDRNRIGLVDLQTCLKAVYHYSPELADDNDRDYTIYAFDYSEPDTPLVGQGLLSRAMQNNQEGNTQFVTGRVTKNMLAIFGNGISETLEVKLRLTAVSRAPPPAPAPTPAPAQTQNQMPHQMPHLHRSASTMSENTEWNSYMQHSTSYNQSTNNQMASSPGLAPARPFNSSYEARNDYIGQGQSFHTAPSQPGSRPGSRPGSAEPNFQRASPMIMDGLPPSATSTQNQIPPDTTGPPKPVTLVSKNTSRPSSRASSKAPTGRPRGRPRKKPAAVEGSTSGYEDGTDADDGPGPRKRAKITQVERSNSATFGSAPDSLRVAASTSGSIRNFRPVAAGGDATNGAHLQEVPRAPTPVPEHRSKNFPLSRTVTQSNLRQQSMNAQDQPGSLSGSFTELNRSMSQSQDARSPVDSLAPSPAQTYSDGPSPADIGSSPPYHGHVCIAHMPQPDSGFMSGGFEDPRLDEEQTTKPATEAPPAPIVPKPKPKRSRAKKKQQPPKSDNLVMFSETPGPPELLPRTSIYNPPHQPNRKATEAQKAVRPQQVPMSEPNRVQPFELTPVPGEVEQGSMLQEESARQCQTPVQPEMHEQLSLHPLPESIETTGLPVAAELTTPGEHPTTQATLVPEDAVSPTIATPQEEMSDLERVLMGDLNDEHNLMETMSLDLTPRPMGDLTPRAMEGSQERDTACKVERTDCSMEPPSFPRSSVETAEPELPPPSVPASDPVFPVSTAQTVTQSEPPHPQTDMVGPMDSRSNKNYVKKQAIKQKLEDAIAKGQTPPFCTNCGAVQTPTWRKIWKQEHQGVPEYHEYSEKAGCVTAINILERSEDGRPVRYEMVKKALAPSENKAHWREVLLCNPCGIWFSKWKVPRPAEKWDKDQDRLSQVRKKRPTGGQGGRSKKSRSKSDGQMNLTSDAALPTDPLGPAEDADDAVVLVTEQAVPSGVTQQTSNSKGPGSSHSQGSNHSKGRGTPGSPIAVDDGELGATRRLLFPSPRKDGQHKVLGEVAINVVQGLPEAGVSKNQAGEAEKENNALATHDNSDDMVGLFGTPARPSTPPPKSGNQGPFKTPTAATPSHRPITRSVTKSIRSSRSLHRTMQSPSQAANSLLQLQRTPTRTPRSTQRRSPKTQMPGTVPAHLMLEELGPFSSPFTKSINQLLTEANDFMAPPAGDGGFNLDLNHLLHEGDGHLLGGGRFDFSQFLSTDGAMPSSPPTMSHIPSAFGGHLGEEDNGDLWRLDTM
ncbi:GATA transcription factor (Ams2) [Apiospora marii]|uniref:GATA transcription factor (Ams2) n=1 Tax=Apiospora marii TaxID=335849 RepID=A0ABR1R7X2_9PEZI